MLIKDRAGKFLIDLDVATNLDRVNLQRADFSNLQFEGYNFSEIDLSEANFNETTLYWTYFFRANCERATFRNARLCGACLDLVNLRFADFRGAYISLDNLDSGCSLLGADLSSAKLDGADLRGSKYNNGTTFPHGFDPQTQGMLFDDKDLT